MFKFGKTKVFEINLRANGIGINRGAKINKVKMRKQNCALHIIFLSDTQIKTTNEFSLQLDLQFDALSLNKNALSFRAGLRDEGEITVRTQLKLESDLT